MPPQNKIILVKPRLNQRTLSIKANQTLPNLPQPEAMISVIREERLVDTRWPWDTIAPETVIKGNMKRATHPRRCLTLWEVLVAPLGL